MPTPFLSPDPLTYETDAVSAREQLLGVYFTVAELAKALHISQAKTRKLFEDEPGVLHVELPRLQSRRRRRAELRVPAEVWARVRRRLQRGSRGVDVDLRFRQRRGAVAGPLTSRHAERLRRGCS